MGQLFQKMIFQYNLIKIKFTYPYNIPVCDPVLLYNYLKMIQKFSKKSNFLYFNENSPLFTQK